MTGLIKVFYTNNASFTFNAIILGDIVVRHNCDGGQSWESVSGAPVEVKEVRSIKAPYKFMFERMRDTAVALDETICRVTDRLIDKYKWVPEV